MELQGGKIKGSEPSGLKRSARDEPPGNIICMAIKKRMIPPAIKRAGFCIPKEFKRGDPKNVKKMMIASAIKASLRMIRYFFFPSISFNTERKMGMFPIGSISKKRVKAIANKDPFIITYLAILRFHAKSFFV